jgi:hypothetical protein
MHVFATFFFLKKHPDIRVKLGPLMWLLPLLIIGLSYVVFFFSWQLLLQMTAYTVLFHTVLQQFGWFQKSFDSMVDNFSYILYKIIFLCSTILPILYWHTGLNGFGRWYFFNNVIVFFVSPALGPFLMYGSNLVILASVGILAIRKNLLLKPLILLAMTWFVYFYGIVFSNSLLFFILCLVFSHAGGYVLFTYQSILNHNGSYQRSKAVRYSIFQIIVLLSVASFWIYSLGNILNVRDYLIPLQLVPTTFHLAFDSLIWRKNFRTNLI